MRSKIFQRILFFFFQNGKKRQIYFRGESAGRIFCVCAVSCVCSITLREHDCALFHQINAHMKRTCGELMHWCIDVFCTCETFVPFAWAFFASFPFFFCIAWMCEQRQIFILVHQSERDQQIKKNMEFHRSHRPLSGMCVCLLAMRCYANMRRISLQQCGGLLFDFTNVR